MSGIYIFKIIFSLQRADGGFMSFKCQLTLFIPHIRKEYLNFTKVNYL